ncbi:toll/interleukin-1 receptor domain-containing protein [Kitasatospora sp. NPDC101155]|uniref:toll/interleukin-1 receptor domain-containing protein n=1 Tax=Kitasatospora sp. NPDC101155 TaxID=3364097 RepID=UPI0037F7D973
MGTDRALSERPTVFLSHRYRSGDINLFFWRIISAVQEVAFRVDEGVLFTSVTRLERLIRDADGFVGVYPLPGDPQESWDLAALRQEARYFLLELGIAIRAQRPAIVFCDHRYRRLMQSPPSVMVIEYDPQEISDAPDSALVARVSRAYRAFVERLSLAMDIRRKTRAHQAGRVGLLLSREYQPEVREALEQVLNDTAWDPAPLPWPPRLDPELMARLRRLDWAILALDDPAAQMAAGFILGHGVPLLPLLREQNGPQAEIAEQVLFGGSEVGHRKAMLRWESEADLVSAFRTHLKVIGQQPGYIRDVGQATEYFASASRRKEQVFLSYAREDSEVAAKFSTLLRGSFQKVFDYRVKGTIRAGTNWMAELSDGLSTSAVGVLLFSSSYWQSKWCQMEADRLYRAHVEDRVRLLPVCLERTALLEPFSGLQYRALYQSSPEEIVAEFVRELQLTEPTSG